MAKGTQATDPARLLGLLWNPPERVGRSGLSVPGIVDAAIALADAEGLDAVTIRAVAQRLGTGAMSLYTHVPGKPELLELMIDKVVGRTYADRLLPAELDGWQEGVRHIARSNWDNLLAHPWQTEITPGRPILGPGVCDKYEAELAPFDGIGLTDVEIDMTLTALLGLAVNAARNQIGLDRIRSLTGEGDNAWWEPIAPQFAAASAGRHYPLSGRIGSAATSDYAAAEDPLRTLNHGVDLLVTGIEARRR